MALFFGGKVPEPLLSPLFPFDVATGFGLTFCLPIVWRSFPPSLIPSPPFVIVWNLKGEN